MSDNHRFLVGHTLNEFSTGASGLQYRWTEEPGRAEKKIRAGIVMLTMETEDEGTRGVAYALESASAADIHHLLRMLAKKLFAKDPMLCNTFIESSAGAMADSILKLILDRLHEKGIDTEEQMKGFDVNEEVAYSLYCSSRKKGSTHESLVAIDPENARFLDRFNAEAQ